MMQTLRLPHVRAHVMEGRAVVDVVDDELRDMVEDHLIELCDLEYEYLQPLTDGGKACQMVFPPNILLSNVIAALNKLDPIEVERVFRINNPTK